jgi:hypothetical protein
MILLYLILKTAQYTKLLQNYPFFFFIPTKSATLDTNSSRKQKKNVNALSSPHFCLLLQSINAYNAQAHRG